MAPGRATSPALSENEFDISKALFGETDGHEIGSVDGLGVDLDIGGDDGSDDEAFIAARQAASNRKASNLKGKTVKKGGGFQAMGLNAALLKAISFKGYSVCLGNRDVVFDTWEWPDTKTFEGTYSDSKKGDTTCTLRRRRRRYGKNRVRENGGFCHPSHREIKDTQR